MVSKIIIFLFIALLASCQTATDYQNAQAPENKYGFSETMIGPDVYRVSFKGNHETQKETVEDYMLYRIAELAKKKGKTYVRFIDKEIEKNYEILEHSPQYHYRNAYGGPGASRFSYPYYSYGLPPASHSTMDRVKEKFEAVSYVELLDKSQAITSSIEVKSILENIKIEK